MVKSSTRGNKMATKIQEKGNRTSSKQLKSIDLKAFRLKRSLSNSFKTFHGKM